VNTPVTIYHNPRCSKSRETLKLLKDRGIEPVVVEYLKTPPSAAELEDILAKLGLEPRQLLRKKEAPYAELNLADPGLERAALVDAMVRHPVLIERPIVLAQGKAAIGRPPENALTVLSAED
jgi:arsenate reductase